MNEYEAVYLFRELIADLHQSMFGYVGLVSAFLVSGYLVADKLSTVMTLVLITLYSLVALNFAFQILMISTDVVSLYDFILQQKEAGVYDLEWFGNNPAWAGYVVSATRTSAAVGSYIGSLVFFFYQRQKSSAAN